MKIMAIDLGKARTGVAISDKSEGFAFPDSVITEYNEEKLIEKLCHKASIQLDQWIDLAKMLLSYKFVHLYVPLFKKLCNLCCNLLLIKRSRVKNDSIVCRLKRCKGSF